jgi:SsrA-binding protein
MTDSVKVIARNRKAYHDYDISEKYEAGLVLLGSEIKSIRAGRINLTEGFVQEREGELWLLNVHISPYDQASIFGHEPLRPRKLLLRKKEIIELIIRTREKGYTVIPLQLYLKKGRAKLEIGVARGKKNYDKRESLREKDTKRDIERALRNR